MRSPEEALSSLFDSFERSHPIHRYFWRQDGKRRIDAVDANISLFAPTVKRNLVLTELKELELFSNMCKGLEGSGASSKNSRSGGVIWVKKHAKLWWGQQEHYPYVSKKAQRITVSLPEPDLPYLKSQTLDWRKCTSRLSFQKTAVSQAVAELPSFWLWRQPIGQLLRSHLTSLKQP